MPDLKIKALVERSTQVFLAVPDHSSRRTVRRLRSTELLKEFALAISWTNGF